MSRKFIKNSLEHVTVLIFLGLLSFMTLKIFNKVYEAQTLPYIDEMFHIPQAQLYCQNVWTEWDPKITTLPGLYLISYILLKPLEIFKQNMCSVYSLRIVNVVGTIINFLVTYKLLSKLHSFPNSKYMYKIFINLMSAINITIFPLLYFFTFLYYTDVWSTTFTLLMYYTHLTPSASSNFLGAFFGLCAVLTRQTNIIWVGLMVLDNIWNVLSKNVKSKKIQDFDFSIGVLKSLRMYIGFKNREKGKKNSKNIYSLMRDIFKNTYLYLAVCLMFIVFLIINGGVAVGDKSAHSVVLHPMQNLYFLNFAGFFGFPYFANEILSKKKNSINIYTLTILTFIAAVLSETNKMEHPYLLADNRHIAFYIWRKIFGHDVIRRLVIPAYGIAAALLFDLLKNYRFMFRVILLVCIFFNLSFQYLFELRYFIIPFILCRLHFRQNFIVCLEFLYFIIINLFILHLFLNRPFAWAYEPNTLQRFIW